MFVEVEVICRALPMASATPMKRLAKRERRMGSAVVVLMTDRRGSTGVGWEGRRKVKATPEAGRAPGWSGAGRDEGGG